MRRSNTYSRLFPLVNVRMSSAVFGTTPNDFPSPHFLADRTRSSLWYVVSSVRLSSVVCIVLERNVLRKKISEEQVKMPHHYPV